MTFLGSAANEGVKSLGPGAFLVSVLPGAVLVLVLVGLVAAGLYPWQHPAVGPEQDGFPELVATSQGLSAGGAVALVLGVLVVAVLLRPFQIAAVQFLEGYWTSRALGLIQELAIETQKRRRSVALWRADPGTYSHTQAATHGFGDVAAWSRREAEIQRNRRAGRAVVVTYPRDARDVLPTRLGNVLRRAETTAGERYGLDTVTTYPRLHPSLAPRLKDGIAAQLNVLDVASALTLVMSALAVASAPVVTRPGLDPWRFLPLLFVLGAVVSHRGARRAAALYGELLLVAYDLHRFDLLRSLHRPLPAGPKAERLANAELTRFLTAEDPVARGSVPPGRYDHPTPETGGTAAPEPAPNPPKG